MGGGVAPTTTKAWPSASIHEVQAIDKLKHLVASYNEVLKHQAEKPRHRREAHLLNDSWWVISAEAELHILQGRRGADSWQLKTVRFFHRRNIQIFFIALLLLDVIVVFVELFLDAEYPRCELIRRDAISCCNSSDVASSHHRRLLASTTTSSHGSDSSPAHHGNGHHAFCVYDGHAFSEGLEPDCDAHAHTGVHDAHDVLFGVSVGILSMFAIELLLLLLSLDVQFFHNLLYIIDFFVVYASLVLEIALKTSSASDITGAIILARLWRFMRVAHGLATASHEAEEGENEKAKQHNESVERLAHEVQAQVSELRQQNQSLEAELRSLRAA